MPGGGIYSSFMIHRRGCGLISLGGDAKRCGRRMWRKSKDSLVAEGGKYKTRPRASMTDGCTSRHYVCIELGAGIRIQYHTSLAGTCRGAAGVRGRRVDGRDVSPIAVCWRPRLGGCPLPVVFPKAAVSVRDLERPDGSL